MSDKGQAAAMVSFIIISYKHADYIADCLESILHQTYTNMEILYLDDCSDDGTYEAALKYLKRLEKRFNRVFFSQNVSNQGLVHNLNRLVQKSQGKYIKFLAADDFMLPDGISDMVEYMEKFPEIDLLYTNGIQGNENVHFPITEVAKYPRLYEGNSPSGVGLMTQLYQNDFIAAPGVLVRRDTYSKYGLYDEAIGIEDWDFYLRIAEYGMIGFLNKMTVCYRILDSSMSHSSLPQKRVHMRKSEFLILEKYKDKVENSNRKITSSLNEALRDAYHIDNAEYLLFLKEYAKRNRVKISMRNRVKAILYYMGIIRKIEQRKEEQHI